MNRSLIAVAVVSVSCAHTHSKEETREVDYAAVVADPDRTDEDRALDAGRKPAEFLDFTEVRPGMAVGELFAGGGYTTELLARAVGPTGLIWAQNVPELLAQFLAKPWDARLARPVNANVRRADRSLEDPFPAEVAGTLDLVVTNANYHDAVATNVDRSKMNGAVRTALKSGGAYVVCDSSALTGTGGRDAATLHRVDEKLVEDEVRAAGFRFEERGDFLRNAADTRDWSVSPRVAGERRGQGDRFCLRFVKP